MTRPQVVFFGSGPVAAACLELLLEWCDVEAVITKPQPPHHKQTFPVIAVAEDHGLPMHFATRRSELDDVMTAHTFASQAAVLIDYGIIISQAVIDSFPLGIVNSHFSLLPEWRGADPISFSILSGQPQTGVSLMLLVQAMDEGPVLTQGTYDIQAGETTTSLTNELIKLSDALLSNALPAYIAGTIKPRSQEDTMQALGKPYQPTYSRKLTKDDSLLDFTKPAAQLEREIRAFIEWPKSRTTIANKETVIISAVAADSHDEAPAGATPGTLFATTDKHIGVITADGILLISRLKPAGKPEMTTEGFLAGNAL